MQKKNCATSTVKCSLSLHKELICFEGKTGVVLLNVWPKEACKRRKRKRWRKSCGGLEDLEEQEGRDRRGMRGGGWPRRRRPRCFTNDS